MDIPKLYQDYFKENQFEAMTKIQESVYMPFKEGKGLIAMAPTGSGKTLAFTMPMLETLVPGDGLQVLILEPSQELAIQVRTVIQPLAKLVGCSVQAVTGGANPQRQLKKLREKPEILVATLGRLKELTEARKVRLGKIQTVIVDEADEMLNESKLESVRETIDQMPGDVQMTFFSATGNEIFKEMHKWFGQDFLMIDQRNDSSYTAGIKHYFINAASDGTKNALIRELAHNKKFKGMIFFNNSRSLHKVISDLRYNKTNYVALDSKMSSQQRKSALHSFSTKKVNLMLTTDVAARGMDINNITTVVNYMIPRDDSEYVHRGGRTGRMGKAGSVLTFGNSHDFRNLQGFTDVEIKKVFLNRDGTYSDKETYQKEKRQAQKTQPKPKQKKRLRDQKNKGKRRAPKAEH
ncbi:DEAD/DEAH box helicase [Companilactobacillus nodensis]|uniref:ATP-dependent RNA helicase n=1 Tax=Companilactobacillus nodensis DSM 19682 = JCM 14932 = NBRC 107160 TaxID=1423775 RepID=A0A0R1K6E2_9LACO|nr:DEAD/DEAH box helicase [Companilactobacillus nodensis]KRK79181.1 ATP-dependent RNA helicase [Companilactobacillus nodensis DSM 19682 = JCM 14932 = NBRC 107160]